MTGDSAQGIIRFLHEAGQLKHSRRTGWWRAGIRDPESVAEHSWRTGIIAWVIASAEGADPERTAVIGLFHDLAEARTGDLDYVGKHYLSAASAEAVSKDQVRDLPPAMAEGILSVVTEMEARATPEAVCARDADKIECLLQAREYERQGHPGAREWADSMMTAVRTETGRKLAKAAMTADPADWWREVSALHRQ